YERAANRVSASKLWEVARALSTNVSYFYEGLTEAPEPGGANLPHEAMQDFLMTPEGIELAAIFPKIAKSRVRRKVLDLVRAMAGEPERDET
ncbi:MAG: transcriptional regulator, partial [Proteobacteria bacterium]|nr:transcriptional regulator [Pseudomonadota bacterium]